MSTDAADSGNNLAQMSLPDLSFLGALALLAPNGAAVGLRSIGTILTTRVILEPIALRDVADAAAVLVLLQRAVSHTGLGASEDPEDKVVSRDIAQ